MRVLELMRSHVVTISPTASLAEAVDKLDLYQVSGLPVLDENDRLIGVVTEHDVISWVLPGSREGKQDPASVTVSEVMTAPAAHIDEYADVMDAVRLMLERRIKRLPVTSGGRLVGIISRIDVCQAILEGRLSS